MTDPFQPATRPPQARTAPPKEPTEPPQEPAAEPEAPVGGPPPAEPNEELTEALERLQDREEHDPPTAWLIKYLTEHGASFPADIQAAADEAGYSKSQMTRAKYAAGAESVRTDAGWVWNLNPGAE